MKKSFIALLALVTLTNVAMAQEISGTISERKLVQSSSDEDSSTYAKTVSKTAVIAEENATQGFEFAIKASSRTSWTQGASIYDVNSAKLTVKLTSVAPFGSTGEGQIVLFENDGEGRAKVKKLNAKCSVSGNQKELSCTSEFLANGNFVEVKLNR